MSYLELAKLLLEQTRIALLVSTQPGPELIHEQQPSGQDRSPVIGHRTRLPL